MTICTLPPLSTSRSGTLAAPAPAATAALARPPVRFPVAEADGIPIAALTFAETADLLTDWLVAAPAASRPRRVATANLDFLRIAREDPAFRQALVTSDLVTADGWPVVWLTERHAARCGGPAATERVAGSDLVPELIARCAAKGRSVWFLGGAPGTAAESAAILTQRYPGLRVAGVSAPRVDLKDTDACARIAAEIRAARTDLLLVGLGAPKQDLFLARWITATGARVGIGVGGTFDFLSGRIQRAPGAFRATGLEWAWRLAKEPRRLAGRYGADAAYLAGVLARGA